MRTGDYEQEEGLPGRAIEGRYLPGISDIKTPAYTEETPLESQEDIYGESVVDEIMANR